MLKTNIPVVSNKPPKQQIAIPHPKLSIDRISITIDPEPDDPDHKPAIRECMIHFSKADHYPFQQYGRMPAKGGRYESALRIHAPAETSDINCGWSKEVFALLQCNPRNGMGGYLRLEWNPNSWGPAAASHLFGVVSEVMIHTAQFPQLLADAKVTRLDVALDIQGIRPDRYHWELEKGVYRDLITKAGRLETGYLGNRSAAGLKGIVRVYDKGIETGDPATAWTRVERDYRSNGRRVRDLPDLPNLFGSLRCRDLQAALEKLGVQGLPPISRSLFCDAAALRGCRAAIRQLGAPSLEQRMTKAAAAATPAFWEPNAIWSMWPGAVAKVFDHPFVPPIGLCG